MKLWRFKGLKLPKWTFKKRLTISQLLSLLLSGSLILTLAIVGGFSLNTIFESKYQDTIGLLFADAERLGYTIRADLEEVSKAETAAALYRHPDGVLAQGKDGLLNPIYGDFGSDLRLQDFKLTTEFFNKLQAPYTVVQASGESFIARSLSIADLPSKNLLYKIPPEQLALGSYLLLWRVPDTVFRIDGQVYAKRGSTIYIVSRESRLLFTNDASISALELPRRPLVRSFIESPLAHGYLKVKDDQGQAILGAFYEVPLTNVVVFVETTEAMAMASLFRVVQNSLLIFLAILVGSVVLLQFPLQSIVLPISRLAEQAEDIARGNFNLRTRGVGKGEVLILSEAFNRMCSSLIERDKRISHLAKQELEKIELKNELIVAQNIQNNLLPSSSRLHFPGLDIEARYVPASLCAGDWYFVHHEPATGESIFIIADVSGHGVGASMFTAIVAGIFNIYVRKDRKSWTFVDFANEVNSTIFNLGKREWHVSLIIGSIVNGTQEIEMLFAGHVPPCLSLVQAEGLKQKLITAPSDLIGLTETATFGQVRVPFPKGATLVLYTDGLTEGKNPRGKNWGTRQLMLAIQRSLGRSTRSLLGEVLHTWDEYRVDVPAEDDVCVITLVAS